MPTESRGFSSEKPDLLLAVHVPLGKPLRSRVWPCKRQNDPFAGATESADRRLKFLQRSLSLYVPLRQGTLLRRIEWYSSPELRDRCRAGLNKGEAGNKLTRAVFFHERGEIRDGSFESQAFRASGLNLAISAIVLWNTVYLSRAVESLRAEGHNLPDDVIRHISPQIWEHINLTGIYDWMREPPPEGIFRPLRIAKFMAAA